MTPFERHERRMREINEEYQQNVAQLARDSKRSLRRIVLVCALLLVVFDAGIALIAWLLEGAGK